MTNATLTRVDAPPGPGPGGDTAAYVPGPLLSVRCVLDDPTFTAQRLIDQMELSSTAVLYVKLIDMPTAQAALLDNAQVLVQQDGTPPQTLRVDKAMVRIHGGQSHVQCFVRAL